MFELLPHVSADGRLPICCNATQLPFVLLHSNAVRRPGVCLEAVWKESIALTQPLCSPSTHRLFTSLFDWETFAEKDTLVLISLCISVTLWGSNNCFLIRLFFSPGQVKFTFEEKIVIVLDWGHRDVRGKNHLCSYLNPAFVPKLDSEICPLSF